MTAARTPTRITPALLRRWPLPALDPAHGKVARGSLLVVGGSNANAGAVTLAATAGLRAGAGTIVVATSERRVDAVVAALPEARVVGLSVTKAGELAAIARTLDDELAQSQALVVGPGMTAGRAGTQLLRRCADRHAALPCVVDAAVLADLSPPRRAVPWILTPHPGEMASMCDSTPARVLADPMRYARAMARTYRAVVVLKTSTTYIATPDGTSYENTDGNLGLGTAGSGDVLAGIIGGLCARRATPIQAAVWGVHLHARAGDALSRRIGPLGYLASELLRELPALLARFARRPPRR